MFKTKKTTKIDKTRRYDNYYTRISTKPKKYIRKTIIFKKTTKIVEARALVNPMSRDDYLTRAWSMSIKFITLANQTQKTIFVNDNI